MLNGGDRSGPSVKSKFSRGGMAAKREAKYRKVIQKAGASARGDQGDTRKPAGRWDEGKTDRRDRKGVGMLEGNGVEMGRGRDHAHVDWKKGGEGGRRKPVRQILAHIILRVTGRIPSSRKKEEARGSRST